MSEDQKEKLRNLSHDVFLPLYRTLALTLLGVVSFFVTRIYGIVVSDHEASIRYSEKIEQLEKLPPRVDKLEQEVAAVKAKFKNHVEEN